MRLSLSLDKETEEILRKLSRESEMSYSALIRYVLKFFSSYGKLLKDPEKIKIWLDLLQGGEHVVLDVDHWLLFLEHLEKSERREKFYKDCRRVSRSHAEQLSSLSPEEYLKRLEACNFFRLNKGKEGEFTLVLNLEASKRFVKELLQDTLRSMGYGVEVKEDMAKLRIRVSEGREKEASSSCVP